MPYAGTMAFGDRPYGAPASRNRRQALASIGSAPLSANRRLDRLSDSARGSTRAVMAYAKFGAAVTVPPYRLINCGQSSGLVRKSVGVTVTTSMPRHIGRV